MAAKFRVGGRARLVRPHDRLGNFGIHNEFFEKRALLTVRSVSWAARSECSYSVEHVGNRVYVWSLFESMLDYDVEQYSGKDAVSYRCHVGSCGSVMKFDPKLPTGELLKLVLGVGTVPEFTGRGSIITGYHNKEPFSIMRVD